MSEIAHSGSGEGADSGYGDAVEASAAPRKFQFPSSFTILALVTLLVWVLVFFIPSGRYAVDEDGAPIPGSYERVDSPQDFGERVHDLFIAPVNGLYGVQDLDSDNVGPFNTGALYGAAGVFLFVLAIGAFMTMVFATGALEVAIGRLAHAMRDQGWLLIVSIMSVFSLLGTTMGFAEETLGFYALMVPLMLALGYDRMVAVAVLILGASIGSMASTVNPFSIGVASGEAGISIGDGILLRVILWVVLTAVTIGYVLRYAGRVRSDRTKSLVGFEGDEEMLATPGAVPEKLTGRQMAVLGIMAAAFGLMIFSVIPWSSIIGSETAAADYYSHETLTEPYWFELGWWFPELTALFIVGAVVVGVVAKLGEQQTSSLIARGAGDFIGPAIVVVLARGVTVIMNNTQTIDTVLNAMESLVDGASAGVFAVLVFLVNIPLAVLIPSSSGHATLAMPLLAPLGDFADVPRSLVITAWCTGAGWVRLITPTSAVIMGGLALGKVSYDQYVRFVVPLMGILAVVTAVILGVSAAIG